MENSLTWISREEEGKTTHRIRTQPNANFSFECKIAEKNYPIFRDQKRIHDGF